MSETEHYDATVIEGHARFEGPHRIRVGDSRLEADRIFVNVGARPSVPEVPGLDRVVYLTSSQMMEIDFLPGHLLVIGGGYIGLEFAQCIAVRGDAAGAAVRIDCEGEVDGRGYITVDERLRTTAPGIWALGDCNGRGWG